MKHYIQFCIFTLLFLVFIPSILVDTEAEPAITIGNPTTSVNDFTPRYKRMDLPVDQRVNDLIGRMTVAEKARQLDMYSGCEDLFDTNQNKTIGAHHINPDAIFDSAFVYNRIGNLGIGSIHDLYPSPRLYNEIQAWLIKSNRLGIPALFIEEGLHGYYTIFPQSVNLATTWNRNLAKQTGAAIAAEARANGVDMILAPVLDIARDPRWGRVEEDFGEDPYLSGQLGLAYVQGMQGTSLATDHNVIAEPKHFAGHGSPESGLNMSPVHAGEREIRSIMLKSFEPAVRDGNAMGIMAAYNDIDGVPCTENPWLLNKVLRGEWGFKGFVLSDLGAINRLYSLHHVAANPAEAVQLALNSGVDMQFYDFDHRTFQNAVIDGVNNGTISSATLDAAVSRILRVKFLLGLFDHPFIDETLNHHVDRNQTYLDLSLDIARQSMCLLKNNNEVLPLKKDLKRIAIIGPNGNTTRLGDYAGIGKEGPEFGIFNQVKQLLPTNTSVMYLNGNNIREAVDLAKKSDVVILALGEKKGISGEGFDRSSLDLPGNQEALMEAVVNTGVPVVLVLQNGRALTIPWAAKHVPAILEAWYPGEFGGRAIAETLFGDNNPAGRLPVSFPKSIGQLPVFYNHFPTKNQNYIDGDNSPQYVFGYGLSYTTFHYDHLIVNIPVNSDYVAISFDVKNTGARDGDEVVQAYIHKTTASVVTPVEELKAFCRIHLLQGELKHITFNVKLTELSIWGVNQEWKTEPGKYIVTVGGSSAGGISENFILK